jgi:CRISPR-associated protein Cmr6
VRALCAALEETPVEPPVVERDVINPIMGAYYRDRSTPPANYLSPSPIFFLAVGSRSRYQFGVASLSGDSEAAEQGARRLRVALTDIGCGAKTGAGYGYWIIEETS